MLLVPSKLKKFCIFNKKLNFAFAFKVVNKNLPKSYNSKPKLYLQHVHQVLKYLHEDDGGAHRDEEHHGGGQDEEEQLEHDIVEHRTDFKLECSSLFPRHS